MAAYLTALRPDLCTLAFRRIAGERERIVLCCYSLTLHKTFIHDFLFVYA